MADSDAYQAKKARFRQCITIYGRQAVLEALQQDQDIIRLHLASSNREARILADILQLAQRRNIEILYHDKAALSRISKNARQDQGVAADIRCPAYQSAGEYLDQLGDAIPKQRFLALDGITNPQNLGMIIRSVCAGHIHGIILARQGNASLGPLVIKASAGTLFKTPILHCESLPTALRDFHQRGFSIYGLDASAEQSLFNAQLAEAAVLVLGNESEGLSADCRRLCDQQLSIPMNNGVESLNVAVTAGIISFLGGG